MADEPTIVQRGPRAVLEWLDEEITTIEVDPVIDSNEIGHIRITIEQRPPDWDETEKVLPSVRIQMDLDGTSALKVRDALDKAIEWGREYLS